MRRESAAIVLVVLLVAAAAGTALADLDFGSAGKVSANLSTSESTGAVPSNCTTTFSGGLPTQEAGNQSRLFVILPGSTGLICVTYTLNDSTPLSPSVSPLRLTSSIYVVNATYENNSNGEGSEYFYSSHLAPGLTESTDPPSVDLPLASGDSFTVVYSVTASKNATGFYSLSFTGSCPSLIPFAVTTDSQAVTPSDYTGFFASGCVKASIFAQVLVTGIAQMNTSLLDGK
ncbi:MAG: hypothetical protein OK456_00680 [Thaumarchaeota archaeon]|nr:hypothetical protein [Nitrososphaerota archaeon]